MSEIESTAPETTPETTPQNTMPEGYRKIEQGENNWTDQLHDNFTALAEGMGDNDAVNEKLSTMDRNLSTRLEEMQVNLNHALADKIGREEFEASQNKQDFAILALQAAMDTGFVGTSFVFGFQPGEIHHWQGYGGGTPEGAVNAAYQLTN